MQLDPEKSNSYNFLTLFLGLVSAAIILANMFGEEITKYVGNITYIPITGALFAISLYNFSRYKTVGKHGIAWLFFMIGCASWFIAESTWVVYELVLDIDPFPSSADIFYVMGYPMMFIFMRFYLEPVKKAITRKIACSSIAIAVIVLLPTVYFTVSDDFDIDGDLLEQVLLITYPILDVIILAPAIMGLMLFFRGGVNFSWTMILLGILMMAVGDTAFYFTDMNEEYFTGHPIEISYYWAYLLLIFGTYNQILVFRTKKIRDLRKAH